MQRVLLAAVMALALGGGVSTAAAQVPNGGYYSGGFYYAPGTSGDSYWPTNSETAYDYGVYAVAPGFGPYLRLGGESGWNPNIGTTYNSYPGGNYYTDYGLPYIRVGYPFGYPLSGYRTWPAGSLGFCQPGYPYCH
jgi:hypothetical protein